MSDQVFEKLKTVISDYEKAQLDMLHNAEESCMKTYQVEMKSSQLNDWNAAKTAREKLIAELEKKYFDAPPFFKNIKEAHDYIVDQGYKCKKSKIYKDKDAGRIRTQPDGTVLESEILAYVAGLKKIGGKASGELEKVHLEKAQAELQKIKTSEERQRFDLDRERGKYILRDDVVREIILKLAAMEAGVKHLIRIRAVDYIHKVGGMPEKSAMLIELMESEIDELWNGFCEFDELNIVVRKSGDKQNEKIFETVFL